MIYEVKNVARQASLGIDHCLQEVAENASRLRDRRATMKDRIESPAEPKKSLSTDRRMNQLTKTIERTSHNYMSERFQEQRYREIKISHSWVPALLRCPTIPLTDKRR